MNEAPAPEAAGLREALSKLAEDWERVAARAGERVFAGDPAATMATVQALETCATALRAAIAVTSPQPALAVRTVDVLLSFGLMDADVGEATLEEVAAAIDAARLASVTEDREP